MTVMHSTLVVVGVHNKANLLHQSCQFFDIQSALKATGNGIFGLVASSWGYFGGMIRCQWSPPCHWWFMLHRIKKHATFFVLFKGKTQSYGT
jgi:hypothetical protein